MKILYIHQYFRTPEEGGSTRSYELAKGLVEKGHSVIMITSHNQISGIKNIEGIEVHYLKIPYQNDFGFLKRIYAFLRFVELAKKESKHCRGMGMAYVMTTPLTTGLVALFLKKKLQIPYVFEVGDLWPEAPIQMGVIKNGWLIKKLYAFEKRCYREAKSVVAMSPSIKDHIKKVAPEVETYVIPNISDCDYFKPSNANNKIFQIGYFGTFGLANDLSRLIQLAKTCELLDLPVQFTLMGEGAEEQKLKQASKGVKNIALLPFGNKEKVRSELERMDAIYISYKDLPVLTTGSPNKLFDGLAAGKLIIINFQGWIKILIESSPCGFSHHTDLEFIDKIKSFLEDPALLNKYQQNSRQLAETEFNKSILTEKLNTLLTRCCYLGLYPDLLNILS